MALARDHNRLPCSVELEAILEQVTDGTPAHDPLHQASCPYCQTALRGFRHGWDDLRTLAREPVPIPPGLASGIMTRVRTLAQRTLHNIIIAGPRGHTQISHDVIAQIARRASLAVPGVLFASARTRPSPGGDPSRLSLTIGLVTTYGPKLRPLAAVVRAKLRRRVPGLTGAGIEAIDITFIDVVPPGAGGDERIQ